MAAMETASSSSMAFMAAQQASLQSLGHGSDALAAFVALVAAVEDACLTGRALSPEELSRLDSLRAAARALEEQGEVPPAEDVATRLRGLGHRLWCACAADSPSTISKMVEPSVRVLACDLFAAGCAFSGAATTESAPSQADKEQLAAQWALAGRACSAIDSDEEALRCFGSAVQPWCAAGFWAGATAAAGDSDAGGLRLAEVALQALLWTSDVHFKRSSYEESFAALAQARDAMESSPGLRSLVLHEFLRSCYEQAAAHRKVGNNQLAAELLTLALAAVGSSEKRAAGAGLGLAALPNEAEKPETRARLLRQLALCSAASGDRAMALACAREAVMLGPENTSHHCASLQVLLRILLEKSASTATTSGEQPTQQAMQQRNHHEEEEVRHVAVSLMRQPAAQTCDCLGTCEVLLLRSENVDLAYACLFELSTRLGASQQAADSATTAAEASAAVARAMERLEVFRFLLRLLSQALEVALQKQGEAQQIEVAKTRQRLMEVMADAERVCGNKDLPEQMVIGVRKAASATLLSLSRLADTNKLHELAAELLQRSTPFLTSEHELGECYGAVANIMWLCGKKVSCKSFASLALSHDENNLQASVLMVLLQAEAMNVADAAGLRALLQSLESHPAFAPTHAALLAHTLVAHPSQDVVFAALELFARKMVAVPAAAAASTSPTALLLEAPAKPGAAKLTDGLHVVAELVSHAVDKKRRDEDLVRYLQLAAECLKDESRRVALTAELSQGAPGQLAQDLCRIFGTAWKRAQALGKEKKWLASAAVLEAAAGLLENLDDADVRDILEARAWCLALMASAALMRSKEGHDGSCPPQMSRSELCQRALECLGRAHQVWQRAGRASVSLQSAAGMPTDGQSSRLFPVLVLLEFEVRCLADGDEKELRQFAEEASSQPAVGPDSLLAMAKVASASGAGRGLSMHCLQRFLRRSVGAHGAADYCPATKVSQSTRGFSTS
eukprot:TRINITY_DN47296_c0_g1_i2.p1 TRINITY_DN47296_c0_g1~~TRINITY_DN47296_c0_g1_i2.p1  ORF type:complete len:966 (+),score=271.41 TRINITY_DN47296_c0_g1_i2:74-2971(+)